MTRFTKHLALIALTAALTAPTLVAAPPPRGIVVSSFGLELGGTFVGFITKVEGGSVFANVVKEPSGEDFFLKKHLTAPSSRDIVLEFGAGMDSRLYEWIKGSLQRQYLPKSGAVLTIDYKGDVLSRLEFENAQITQITFPALDGKSKEQIRFSIRLTPTSTSLNRKPVSSVPVGKRPNALLASSFRLAIDGLDMSHALEIDALTIDLPLVADPASVCLHCDPTPTPPIDFANLIVTLSAAHADTAYDWLEDFVINGNNSDESERSGALDYLSADFHTSLFQLAFKGLGIFEIAPVPTSNTDTIARVVVAMYCEQIAFNFF